MNKAFFEPPVIHVYRFENEEDVITDSTHQDEDQGQEITDTPPGIIDD